MEAIDPNIFRLTIFVLSIFVGYYVVWSVTPALHTPLMAVTNAISSVIIVGGLFALVSSTDQTFLGILSKSFGFIAVLLAAVNIFGGFLVTQRMLAMYKKKPKIRIKNNAQSCSSCLRYIRNILYHCFKRPIFTRKFSKREYFWHAWYANCCARHIILC